MHNINMQTLNWFILTDLRHVEIFHETFQAEKNFTKLYNTTYTAQIKSGCRTALTTIERVTMASVRVVLCPQDNVRHSSNLHSANVR